MNFELNPDEQALVLDALAEMPLKRSYTLFQRLLAGAQAEERARQAPPPAPEPAPDVAE